MASPPRNCQPPTARDHPAVQVGTIYFCLIILAKKSFFLFIRCTHINPIFVLWHGGEAKIYFNFKLWQVQQRGWSKNLKPPSLILKNNRLKWKSLENYQNTSFCSERLSAKTVLTTIMGWSIEWTQFWLFAHFLPDPHSPKILFCPAAGLLQEDINGKTGRRSHKWKIIDYHQTFTLGYYRKL